MFETRLSPQINTEFDNQFDAAKVAFLQMDTFELAPEPNASQEATVLTSVPGDLSEMEQIRATLVQLQK